MRRLIAVICCLAAFSSLASASRQSDAVLTGSVLDKAGGNPVAWTTVSLSASDSTVVAVCSCSEEGTFELKAPAGSYILAASLIGYQNHSMTVSLKEGLNELEPILLEEDAQMLQGAVTTVRQNLVEMKIDKVVMNVSESSFAHGSNALELIKKAPGVTVDKDGNVKLNGQPVSVWIDGRPSYLDGKSLESLLRSTNSESIDKFELMEHPSAKYDAAGQGGIINIKTRRNQLQGLNGTVGLGGGGMHFKDIGQTPWQQSARVNLSYRTARTNTFLNVSEETDITPIRIVNELSILSAKMNQKSNSLMSNFTRDYNVKVGTDWFVDDRNTLGAIAIFPGSRSTFNTSGSSSQMYLDGVLTQKTSTGIKNGPSLTSGQSVNLNYTHVFNPELGSEITVNADYYHNVSKEKNSQSDTTEIIAIPDPKLIMLRTVDADNIYDIYSVKADYQAVVGGKFMLEAGAKWALSKTDNNSVECYTGSPDYHSFFSYNEHIAAAYASLAGQLSPKMSFKAGLRAEYTNSFGDWKSSGTQTRRDYLNLFPTVYLGYAPSEKWRLSASYSRRINRPGYYQLNPTKTFMDSKSYLLGNPDILPQIGGTLSLGAGYGNHLSLALAYQYAYNQINQIPSYGADGTQFFTWGNFGKQRVAVAALNVASLPIGKWLQWTLSVNGMYLESVEDATGQARECFSGQGYTDFSVILPHDWKVDLDAYMSLPVVYGNFETHTAWASNLAVKKTLMDNRLTLTLRLDDIFRTQNGNMDIRYPDGSTVALQQLYYSQKLVFDISWSFGKAQKPLKQRSVGDLEEVSRVGGSGNKIGN